MSVKHIAYLALSSRFSVFVTDTVVRRFQGGKVRNRGSRIDTNNPAVTPWVRTLVYWDMYETSELRFIERYLPPDLDVIELGGSIGVVASQIARRLEPGRRLVSVEANPRIVDLLRENVTANGPQVRAEVVHGAIAYAQTDDGNIEMSFGDSTLSSKLSGPDDRQNVVRVPAVRLSELLARYQVDQFSLVADIEGAEAALFAHEKQALARCRWMIVELHDTHFEGRDLSIQDVLRLAIDAGFVCRDQHRNVFALENQALAAPETR